MNTLTLGTNSAEVCTLQTRLNAKPPTALAFLSADGMFGPKTQLRVKEFQKNNSLVVDGIVGPKTWAKLLTPEPASKRPVRFCDDCVTGNTGGATARFVATTAVPAASFGSATAAPIAGASFLGISLPKIRSLTAAEIKIATSVYGSSIDFSTVTVTDATGIGGAAFVVGVPNPFGKPRQIMNMGPAPTRDTLIHELAHVWQSQHHSDSTRFMVNSVASQALAVKANALPGSKSFSAYGYRPGLGFGNYAAEQIAQQAMRGEPPIIAHMRSVGIGAVDAGNVASLKTPRIEDLSLPGVKV